MMNDQYIYPCIIAFMKVTLNKQVTLNPAKQFFHTHLIIKHFIQSKNHFGNESSVYKQLLKYYEEKCLLIRNKIIQHVDSDHLLHIMNDSKQKQLLLTQIVIRVLYIGIESHLKVQPNRTIVKQLKNLCENLTFQLVIECQNLSEILLPFIQKITLEIKNLQFYEGLLHIFQRLQYFNIIQHLELCIKEFKAQWQKNMQKRKSYFISRESAGQKKKFNRDSVFMPTKKQTHSVDFQINNGSKKENKVQQISRTVTLATIRKNREAENLQSQLKKNVTNMHIIKQKNQSVQKVKIKEQTPTQIHSALKRPSQAFPPTVSNYQNNSSQTQKKLNQGTNTRRKTIYNKSKPYSFNPKKSGMIASQQNRSYQVSQYSQSRQSFAFSSTHFISQYNNFHYSRQEETKEGVLAQSTPQKRKRHFISKQKIEQDL